MLHSPRTAPPIDREPARCPAFLPWIVACLCAQTLAGCATYSKLVVRQPSLALPTVATGVRSPEIDRLRGAIRTQRRDPLHALGTYLAAARDASLRLQRTPDDTLARAEYNFATARIVALVHEANLDPWSAPLRLPDSAGGLELVHSKETRARWNPARYDITPADQFDVRGRYVSRRVRRDGIGAPTVAVGKEILPDSRSDFAPSCIYYGVTAVARFQGRRCVLSFEDPLAAETTDLGGRRLPLAADFTVPLAAMLEDDANNPKKLGWSRYFRPGKYDGTAQIVRLEPYDPDKTVVLVIHGLTDSQATWTPLINSLRGDQGIRRNYQFWFFSYPTGYPYPYSAALLRRELDGIRKRFGMERPIVVIGHSMGGCIARLLLTDTGTDLWKKIFGRAPEQTRLSPESRALLEPCLIFQQRPEIGRTILIATPLRGSRMATNWLGRTGARLIKSPATLLQVGRDTMSQIIFGTDDLRLSRIPVSVDTLAPNNRFVKAINTIPIAPGSKVHTIVGDRGRGDAPHSSDGIVPYWSSHMDEAISERIVPSGHGAHQHPDGIAEVRRILLLHQR